MLHPLLYPEVLLDSEGEVVQARRMLGVAYLFENKPDEARREFRKLLELRPDYRFDPLLDPQRVVDFFNGVLKEEEATIAEMEERRRQRDKKRADEDASATPRGCRLPPTVVRYERHSFAVNFVPFGAGQFQNGQRRKGWLFFGAEAVLGAVSVGRVRDQLSGSTAWRRNASASTPAADGRRVPAGDRSITRRKTRPACCSASRSSAAGCSSPSRSGASSTPSINHQPEVPLPDGAKVARERSPAARLTFSPNGLGASWAF